MPIFHMAATKNTHVKNFPLFSVCFLLTISLVTVSYTLADSQCDSSNKHLKYGGIFKVREIRHQHIDSLCSVVHSDVRVYVLHEKRKHTNVSHLLFCPSPRVPNITVSFDGHVIGMAESPKSSVTATFSSGDSIQIHVPTNMSDATIIPEVHVLIQHRQEQKRMGRMYLQCGINYDAGTMYDVYIQDEMVPGPDDYKNSRKRRDTSKDSENVIKTDNSKCGKTHGCFRYGSENCQHLECQYFISHRTVTKDIHNSVAHIELSGKTDGWLAIGFSSDNKMGGDDVIACLRTNSRSDQFRMGSFKIELQYEYPVKTTREANLTSFVEKDGFVYCHIEVQLGRRETEQQERNQDLTNEWYQLYARGNVNSGGGMEKHKETPLTSARMISLTDHNNIYTSGGEYLKGGNCFQLFSLLLILHILIHK